MEKQRRKINLVVLMTLVCAVAIGVLYYVTGEPGEETLRRGTLIVDIIGKDFSYVSFLR